MGKYKIILQPQAQKHLASHKKSGDKASIKKIDLILKELAIHPFIGVGKPEALKHELNGFWSRKINAKDRMIYAVKDSIVTVEVVSALGHYSDK